MTTTITDNAWQLLRERLEELLAESKAGRFGLFGIACPAIDCIYCPTRRCEQQLDVALFDDDGLHRCPHGHDVEITKDQLRVTLPGSKMSPAANAPQSSPQEQVSWMISHICSTQ